MSKNLSEQLLSIDLWSWIRIIIVVLLIVGAYSWGVIEGSHFSPKYGYEKSKYGRMDMSQNMKKPYINMQTRMYDPMNMSMHNMSALLEGKTGDALNKAFLEGMIPHHQGAIDMAKYLAASDKPELVKLGADIIDAQTREIEQMQQWMQEWGYVRTGTTSTGIMDRSMMNY